MGRRARLRRHRHADPAAHRAALRRTLGARGRQHARRPVRTLAARHREGLLDARVRRAGLDASATPRASRSPAPISSGSTRCTTASSAARRSQTGDRPRHSCRRPRRLRRTLAIAGATAATGAPPAAAPAAPAQPAPAAAPSAPRQRRPAAASPAPAAGLEIIFRPDPTVWDGRFANNGWLQELPEAADESHLGRHGLAAPVARRSAQPARRRRRSSCVIAATPRACRSSASAGTRASPSRSSSATAARKAGRVGNAERHGAAVQSVPAPHVGRAVVRHRSGNREDRRPAPDRHDAGTPPDGRPQPGARRRRSRSTCASRRSSRRWARSLPGR